jgi:hypothetical protein
MARVSSLLVALSVMAPPVSLAQEQRSIERPAASGLWALGSRRSRSSDWMRRPRRRNDSGFRRRPITAGRVWSPGPLCWV